MGGFSDVARMARPSRVRWMSNVRPAIISTATTMITICKLVIVAPNIS